MKRRSGVLLHISSLWGDYSLGSMGAAFEWIDFLEQCGFSVWQTLPFCLPDICNSPYKSFGAFSLNPFFIDLEALHDEGLISREELISAKQKTPYVCEFDRLKEERIPLLSKAAGRFNEWDEAERFFGEFPEVLDFCRFMALKEANCGAQWNKWTGREYDENVLKTWKFCQYMCFKQWMRVKDYANQKGIQIIGDIPIYVDYDSSDVWSNPQYFQLDEDGGMEAVAAVPPDYFCPDGQLWGNPLYNWDKMKENGYSWWLRRMKFMTKLFDGVRIDHFRAFESYYSVKAGEKTAKFGKWVKGPGTEFVNTIKNVCHDSVIIAEDLGDITDEVRELLESSTLPGMRVLQFAFMGDDNSPHLPHNYERNCVAYTGTHDNNTLLGFVWEMSREQREKFFDYCGYDGNDIDGCYNHIFRMMFRSSADVLIVPVQDLLLYGSDTRINTPGKPDDNWSFRITREQLQKADKNKFYKYNKLYGRI